MDPKSAEQVFWEASQRSSDSARAEYLDQACGDNQALRQKVERLLAVGSAADNFLESPPHLKGIAATLVVPEPGPEQPPVVLEQPGTVIGPYKLLQQIGEGGMGVVYMAEQAVPVKRRVALKIIKPGMDSQQVIARFEAERQALSLMDHPHIAKVLDAGTTPSGRPYFVMELVKGLPISQYCDEHHLTLRQRLELLLPVCQAIQHAHQKGVIHRDIKPSNILVAEYDQKAVPKVIDFGVAKAISQSLTEKTMFTAFGQIVGTIEYMSPEQSKVNQLDVDTRSDIYSLGVLLYELLTGTTPFDRRRLRTAAWDDMLRIIREEEPPRPSTRLSTVELLPTVAANRNIEPAKLSNVLRGELDWIVMKALEKDRSRRYDTVSALAADLQHYLNDEAVVACPPSAAYRLRKFARRNKTALTMSSVVALALLIAVGSIGWMVRDREAREEKAAREQAARELALEREVTSALNDVETWFARENWTEAMAAARRAEGVLAAAESASQLSDRVQQWQRDIQTVIRLDELRIPGDGETQWDWSITGDADYEREFRALGIDVDADSHEAAAELVRAHPIRDQLISALESWAQYRRNIMLEAAQRGLDRPTDWWLRPLVVARLADPDEYRSSIRRALEQEDPSALLPLIESPQTASLPATTLGWIARVLYWSNDEQHRAEAFRLLTQAQTARPDDWCLNSQLADYLHQVDPEQPEAEIPYIRAALALRPDVVRMRLRLASALRRIDRLDEASATCSEVLRIWPDNAEAHNVLGVVLLDEKRWEEAAVQFRGAIELDATESNYHSNLGVALTKLRQLDEAVACCRRAIELDPTFARAYSALGSALKHQHRLDEAAFCCRRAIELDPLLALAHNDLGAVLQDTGFPTEAESCYRRAIELDPNDVTAQINLGFVLRELNRLPEAVASFRRAIELDPADAAAHIALGNSLSEQNRWDEAEAAYRRAIALDSDEASAHYNLGRVLCNQQRLDEAAHCFRLAMELDPASARPHCGLGNVFRDQGRPDEAIDEYQKAIELDPEFVDAHNNLGNVLSDQNRLEEALAPLQHAASLLPASAEVHNNLGVVLCELARLPEAEASYRRAIELDATLVPAWFGLANVLQEQQRLDEAEVCLRTMIDAIPANAEAHYNLGRVLRNQNRINEAIASYREALRIRPAFPEALTNLACHLRDQGAVDEAIELFRQALADDADFPERWLAHRNLADALLASGKTDDALMEYRAAIQLHPYESSLHLSVGVALVMSGQVDQGIQELQEAIRLDPLNPLAHNLLGAARKEKGHTHDAIVEFLEAVRLQPDFASAHFNLAQTYFEIGDLVAGTAHYQSLVQIRPGDIESLNALAWILAAPTQSGEEAAALAADIARLAVDQAPHDGGVWNTLGVARYRLGDWNGAIEALLKSEELSPGEITAFNGFFLAMAHWQLNRHDESLEWFGKSIVWMDANANDNQELRRFHSEAASLIEMTQPPTLDNRPPDSLREMLQNN